MNPKLTDLVADTLYSVDGEITTCVLVLKEGKGSIVGQVHDTSDTAKADALKQASDSAMSYLGLDAAPVANQASNPASNQSPRPSYQSK